MTPPIVFLYPGQGSQAVGMGRALHDADPVARARFEQADAILERRLSRLCFEGPEDELKQTENTQPALYLCAAAATDVLRARGVEPACVAGHSLGEYAALYTARVLDFETGLRLVAARGLAMAEAGRRTPGAMAAIMGLEIDRLEKVCEQASEGDQVVVVANDNSPGQTVISGEKNAVERACRLATEAGAKRALPLPVSGAFHSPLVEDARIVMETRLAATPIASPACKFIPNVTATTEENPESIRAYLIAQVTSRVRWVETVQTISGMGISQALEVGPGKIIAGLTKRIDRDMQVQAAGEPDEIDAAIAALG